MNTVIFGRWFELSAVNLGDDHTLRLIFCQMTHREPVDGTYSGHFAP
jgi:hypothetical protein